MNPAKESGVTRTQLERWERNIATPRRPESFPGTARAVGWCLSKVHCPGLIQIRADFCWPSAYPKPGSRVTTTL
jgi:hypothetical protein